MGLMLSAVISYAGALEAIECIRHIVSGVVPYTDPNFEDLVQYYKELLRNSGNPASHNDWTTACGQGYLYLTEDKKGKLESVAVKYYDGQPSSTAILFSTKISSFGQDSLEDSSQVNGGYSSERYTPTKTKTIISNTSESFSVGNRRTSPSYNETVSDSIHYSTDSAERSEWNSIGADKEKVSWEYTPLTPSTPTSPLPEINFQSYDEDKPVTYSEEYLRSLDGIKYRPLQRSDPSGRRRSFRKRTSSSSSSKDSRASREEEVKMFTSLEEAEFKNMNKDVFTGFGSSPNLLARSHSRSRSRETSRERKHEPWSAEPAVGSLVDDETADKKPRLSTPNLDSFEEKDEMKENDEVTEETEDSTDFWANLGD